MIIDNGIEYYTQTELTKTLGMPHPIGKQIISTASEVKVFKIPNGQAKSRRVIHIARPVAERIKDELLAEADNKRKGEVLINLYAGRRVKANHLEKGKPYIEQSSLGDITVMLDYKYTHPRDEVLECWETKQHGRVLIYISCNAIDAIIEARNQRTYFETIRELMIDLMQCSRGGLSRDNIYNELYRANNSTAFKFDFVFEQVWENLLNDHTILKNKDGKWNVAGQNDFDIY